MEDLRGVAVTHIQGGSHLSELNALAKKFIVTHHPMVGTASKLPAAKKRDDLETICWKTGQQTVKFAGSESVASNASPLERVAGSQHANAHPLRNRKCAG